jgi:N-acetylglutamate synthase-like GNAT family acetyltransferase
MRTGKARAGDADAVAIHRLIAHYSAEGLLLPRSETDIREHIARFLIIEDKDQFAGCVALEPYGAELAEIRSLAVNPEMRGHGLGQQLVQQALAEARRKKFARVFAVTREPAFFIRQGFALSNRHALPEKIERDCRTCPKQRTCRLAAVIMTVCPERIALPVLEASAPVPAV